MRPKVLGAAAIARRTSSSMAMSAATNSAAPPRARMRWATASPVGIDVEHDHPRPFLGEQLGGRRADARGRAGDDRDLVL